MKKLYTLAFASTIAVGLMAQEKVASPVGEPIEGTLPVSLNHLQSEAVSDTLAGPISTTCTGTGPYLTTSANGGYLNGTNGYGDLEKAQGIDASQEYTVTKGLVIFGGKENVIAGNINAYIYDADGTAGGPGTLLGTSDAVSITAVDTSLAFTEFSFSTPVYVDGPFFLSILVENGGDTVGILHTDFDCGMGSAWEKWDDGTWHDMASAWPADLTSYILAEVDNDVSLDDNILSANSAKAFPNPATEGDIMLSYNLKKAGDVTINVTDMTGRTLIQKAVSQDAGRQLVELNTAELPNGAYLYTVQSGEQALNGKFVVRN